MPIPLPAVLIVLDGWGHSDEIEGNAIARSGPRFMQWLGRTYPTALLQASGEAVGLPTPGQLDFVLFLDGDFWSRTARFAGVEEFIRSAERPAPGPATEGRVGDGPGS